MAEAEIGLIGLGVMGANLALNIAAKGFAKWNKGKLNSYLIEITAKVLATTDPKTKKPLVDVIVDRASGNHGLYSQSTSEFDHIPRPHTFICS